MGYTPNPADRKNLEDLITAKANIAGTIQIVKDRGNFTADLQSVLEKIDTDLGKEAADLIDVPPGDDPLIIQDDVTGKLMVHSVKDGTPHLANVNPTLASEVPLKSESSSGGGSSSGGSPTDTSGGSTSPTIPMPTPVPTPPPPPSNPAPPPTDQPSTAPVTNPDGSVTNPDGTTTPAPTPAGGIATPPSSNDGGGPAATSGGAPQTV